MPLRSATRREGMIFRTDQRDDAVFAKSGEGVVHAGAGGFGGDALPLGVAGERVADFDLADAVYFLAHESTVAGELIVGL